jgi:hypothetical protein
MCFGNLLSSRLLPKNVNVTIYEIIILPVGSVWVWHLVCNIKVRLRVLENRVLRRIFGPKRDEGTGAWRKLRIEELHSLYSSPSIIRMTKSRKMRWAGHVAWIGRRGMHYKILVGKPEGKSTLGRPRCRWVYNILTWNARTLLGNGPVNISRPNTHKTTMEYVSQQRNVIARC